MHLDHLIIDLALILIAASVATLIMKKLNQPIVLGYIIAGFLISPNFVYLPTVVRTEDITSWAEIGIIFLMFALGLEFSFIKIANVGGSAFVTALTVMGAMLFIGFGAGQLLGWSEMDCIFLGGMLSMSSTMIILKAYEEYKLKKEKFAQLVMGTLVIEDIAGIFMLIVLSAISVGQGISGIGLVSEIGTLLLMLVVWLIVGIYLIPTCLKAIAKLLNDELLIIVSLAICMGMVLIANAIGFSSALGAFMAGSILAGTVRGEVIERLTKPIKDLFGAVFFISVGMLIQPDMLVEYIWPIIIISIVTMFGQMIFSTLGMLFSGQSLRTAMRGGFSMVQIGEFSFIVASLGMSLGVISDFLYPIVVCVSVITSFLTPVFIRNAENVYQLVDKMLPQGAKVFLKRNTSERQITDDKDDDWKRYLKRIGTRTFICSTAMFVIYLLSVNYILPGILKYSTPDGGKYITAGIAVAAMIPFVALMHGTNKVLYTKLWMKHKANKLPLLTLQFMRVLIASAFIALTLNSLLDWPFLLVMIIAVIPASLIVRSEYIRGKTKRIEMSFVANFYEKTLAARKRERARMGTHNWLDQSIHVVRFCIVSAEEGLKVMDVGRSRYVHLGIIKVIRGDKHYNMPQGTFELKKGDILTAIGTHEEIEASLLKLEEMEYIEKIEYPEETLKDYIYGQTFHHIPPEKQIICVPINVSEDLFFVNKSIKNSRIRERYKGSVIGIERNNLPITHPNISTVIQPGDLLWVIGTKEMATKMFKDDILGKV